MRACGIKFIDICRHRNVLANVNRDEKKTKRNQNKNDKLMEDNKKKWIEYSCSHI